MIKVTVQTQERLSAIKNLSIAVRDLACALKENVTVHVEDCQISVTKDSTESGITINTHENVKETKIWEGK